MEALPTIRHGFGRRLALAGWLLLWPLTFAVWWYPIKTPETRACFLLGLLGLWAGALLLFWSRRGVRWSLFGLAAFAGALTLLPGRDVDAGRERQAYARGLLTYRDAPYVWGGESPRGIDCSGLIRCGLIDADLKDGVRTLNPRLVRQGLSLWWNDCTANDLKNEWHGQTRFLFAAPSLNALDYGRLEPGDFAVTDSGVHTLAYLGNQTWIEAEPNGKWGDKVITVHAPSPDNSWFRLPMHLMRWRQFEGG